MICIGQLVLFFTSFENYSRWQQLSSKDLNKFVKNCKFIKICKFVKIKLS